jgi:hypothetical protein
MVEMDNISLSVRIFINLVYKISFPTTLCMLDLKVV